MLKINVGVLEVTWGTIASHLAINCGQGLEVQSKTLPLHRKSIITTMKRRFLLLLFCICILLEHSSD